MPEPASPPYREIRAHYDDDFITVYQAYKPSIAEAAIATQKLSASPDFRPGRMTWIKPSWSWIMYRSGYSFKDPGQARILALKMRHEHFLGLLEQGVVANEHRGADGNGGQQGSAPSTEPRTSGDEKQQRPRTSHVRIQWDPERTPGLQPLPYRSIQIGIPAGLSRTWTEKWIAEIEDVTDRARALKSALDESPELTLEELVGRDLVPVERPFPVPENLRSILQMDGLESTSKPKAKS
jgi:hypothetical protein